ncbi:hypothetical protein ABZZ17_34235 [Streptomyces sp. NPDC006512]|uniref:hypothetical protein n=1 Tax=Streptomyces sp. NPDC006512 TaxID=3154307 RepID=UPI0033BB297A
MRLRTTAAVLLASFALVLPTAGPSLANDHDDNDTLGELHYRYTNDNGDSRSRTIEPADNDTCYQLPGTRNNPAYKVENDTDSLALLFEGRSCNGQPQEILEPGDSARNLNVRSVFFKPVDDHHHGRHDNDNDNNNSDDHDYDEDEIIRSVLRSIG